MTRNEVSPETAAKNATLPGGYTYNAYPPDGYQGPVFVYEALGIGDHAHVTIHTGTWTDTRGEWDPEGGNRFSVHPNMGRAGVVIMAWRDWERFREVVAQDGTSRIAEVRMASKAQLDYYAERQEA